jgi:hypothetical protein
MNMVSRGVGLLVLGPLVLGTLLSAQPVTLESIAIVPIAADLVRVSGGHAYVGAGRTLTVVDIHDPSAPKTRGSIALDEPVYGLAISDSKGYVANGLRGFATLDLSNPDAPKVIGALKTPGEAIRIALTGSRALVANRMSGVQVIDVSTPQTPVAVGSYYTDGYTRDVAAAGALAYIVDATRDFAVVDVSKTGEPRSLSTQGLTGQTALVAVRPPRASTESPNVYVLGGGVLQVFDLASPASPKTVTTLKISERSQAIAVDAAVAYIAAGPDGLQVIDLSNPRSPVLTGTYTKSGAIRDVVVANDLVLVAAASPPGVHILRKTR